MSSAAASATASAAAPSAAAAAMPKSNSSPRPTGHRSKTKTKVKVIPSKDKKDHRSEVLLLAGSIKSLATLHEQQLLKGIDYKIPAALLKKIRLLNKMLSTTELEVCSLHT